MRAKLLGTRIGWGGKLTTWHPRVKVGSAVFGDRPPLV